MMPMVPKSLSEDPLRGLLGRALEGDRAALDALCRALSGPVYRLALRMLGHPEDAEDATQEILVKSVTHLSSFRGESKVLTWVYTIATRHLIRRRKSRHEREVQVERVAELIDTGLAFTTATSAPDGEARVLAREVRLACTQNMLLVLTRPEPSPNKASSRARGAMRPREQGPRVSLHPPSRRQTESRSG